MAETVGLTDETQAVYIIGNIDGEREIFASLERWKDDSDTWNVYDGDGELHKNGIPYGEAFDFVAANFWPRPVGREIVYDTERND